MNSHLATTAGLCLILLSSYFACHSGHQTGHVTLVIVSDVHVEIGGIAGTRFEAVFEDDGGERVESGSVPFAADFTDRTGYFRVRVTKTTDDTDEVCAMILAGSETRSDCTSEPYGQAGVMIVF